MNTANTAIQIQAIKFVLWVADMDRAVVFYRDVIGLKEKFATPGWSELTYGDAIIGLHGGGDESVKSTGLSIQVSDVDAACEQVAAHGGKIVSPPQAREGEPIKLATVADTEGNQLMLTEYIGG